MADMRAYDDSLDIAIIGMSARFPQARDVDEFWRNLLTGKCAVTWFDVDELRSRRVPERILGSSSFVPAGYLLEDYDLFDAEFFGYSPREAELMDPQHRLLLESGWHALENAGYDADRCDALVGVYAGASNNTYLMFNVADHADIVDAVGSNQVMVGNSGDFLATRLSYKLGLRGPSLTVQTACSTSLVAVALACQGLLAYQCDMALAGGVTADPLKHDGYLYEPDGLFSPDGLCRSFDVNAKGTAAGNGIGMVVLKRLADAVADGDHLRAVIKGSAVNNDGSGRAGFTAPSAQAQALAISGALASGEVDPGSIGYVETHGTATILGDPIEFSALKSVFGARPGHRSIALGSVKTNVGHLDAAAGVAGLIKTTLAVEHGRIPPTLHFTAPNNRIDLDSGPFFINTEPVSWPLPGPRRAGVSSFGLGGTNAHVVLEQAPAVPQPPPAGQEQLLLLSARTEAALARSTERLATYLRERPEARLRDVAATLALGRKQFGVRRVLVCANAGSAATALEHPTDGEVISAVAPPSGRRPVAFMFTGFGDQYPGMAAQLYQTEPVFAAAVDHCAAILRDLIGLDLRTIVWPAATVRRADDRLDLRAMLSADNGGCTELDRALYGHPALFAIEYGLAMLWQSWGVTPTAMIGHSLGEYVAACLAGVFSLEEALRLVVARARLIEIQGGGAMIAVALPAGEVEPYLGDGAEIAAVNGPHVCVVAGAAANVEELAAQLDKEGIACRRLASQAAAHSRFMEPAVEPFADLVREVRLSPPTTRFVSDSSGTWATAEEVTTAEYWARQLRQPVRFSDGVRTLTSIHGVLMVEIGPGQTLCSAVFQHPAPANDEDRVAVPSLPDAYRGGDRSVMLRSLGRLWLAGVRVGWPALHPAGTWQRQPLPGYPFESRRFWLDRIGTRQRSPSLRHDRPAEWIYAASWQRLGDAPADGAVLADQQWLVFADEQGVGEDLARRLRAQGAVVTLVKAGDHWAEHAGGVFAINPASRADYVRLANALRVGNRFCERVVHCWSVTGASAQQPTEKEAVEQSLIMGFQSLVWWAQVGGAQTAATPLHWDVVSTGLYGVAGDEPVCPAKAAVQGVCKVAPLELPSLTLRQIDLDLGPTETADDRLIDQLMSELLAPADETSVAIRGSHRWAPTYVPVAPGPHAVAPLRHQGTYLITGGAGRIGLTIARSLADSCHARLVLVNRTAFPPRERWDDAGLGERERAVVQAVREIEAIGSDVFLVAADVCDEEQMAAAVSRARKQFGRIHGVLHAAGVTGDQAHRELAEIDRGQADWHFRPKIYGTLVLDKLLADDDLDFALLFSSLSSLLGGLGFASYAAANAFLDAFAHQHRGRWTSITWEGWRFEADADQTPGPGRLVNELAISPAEGRSVFELLITMLRSPQMVVSTSDLRRRVELWAGAGAAADAAADVHARPALRNPYIPPADEVEEHVAAVWQELLGVDQVGVQDNFFELGGTSLLGVQVVHRLRQSLRQPVPLTLVYEGPTVRTLASLLRAQDRHE